MLLYLTHINIWISLRPALCHLVKERGPKATSLSPHFGGTGSLKAGEHSGGQSREESLVSPERSWVLCCLCGQRTPRFFKAKMLFSTSVRVNECTPLIIRGRRLNRFVWHQTLNSSKGWKDFQCHGAWLYKGEFHQVTHGVFLKRFH